MCLWPNNSTTQSNYDNKKQANNIILKWKKIHLPFL
jgi:hypothetical protein